MIEVKIPYLPISGNAGEILDFHIRKINDDQDETSKVVVEHKKI